MRIEYDEAITMVEVILEKLETLMWFCATSLGSIIAGVIIAGYILAFVKKTQPDWIKVVALSLIVLLPSIALIWFGIQYSEWNIPVAVIWLVMIAATNFVQFKEMFESNVGEERTDTEALQEDK